MKIALLGAGKTGKKVADLHPDTIIFNTSNPLSMEALQECNIVISFLPGDAFIQYIPLLIESKKPVITGSTGFEWEQTWISKINEESLTWIRGHNFSLGMNLVKSMIEILAKATELYPKAQFSIHDIHHTQKLDSPSGTAISWKKWLNQEAKITAERTGDVVGYHHLEMESEVEKIKITHEAKDRAIFASGAIWAAQQIVASPEKYKGLINFDNLVKDILDI